MTDRPLMSLIDDGLSGHRGGDGLPPGMRSDGIYFLPKTATNNPPPSDDSEDAEGVATGQEAGADAIQGKIKIIKTVAGQSDRVYFLMGPG
eukprot:CAMPEP_0181295374 /NCGR_PEP_ID=MMETSP1101-20121128/4115_1 /TAXON_ID=46948 /ORGANISM="Rhodomonas abbreviata, Strain Caron Lab Isolate" /LENGTH=90 /DNA_ID=CAMNT_0023400125 /DNA_START=207 /DNA_END=476 /DNA_ORIENTATION=+